MNKRDVLEIVSEHLKYSFIPNELGNYKKILKSIITTYQNTDKLPSIGVISQQHEKDIKVQEALTEIKKTIFPDKEILIETLQSFIKQSKFVSLNDKLKELYNEGRHEDAIQLQAKESEEIVNFSIKKVGLYLNPVFQGFNKRNKQRQIKQEAGLDKSDKVLFGIEPLDMVTNGGIDIGDTVLWIMRSGVGKSTALKWHGVSAARAHRNVLHIQLEGSEQEAMDKYDQVWTAYLYNDIKKGNINDKDYSKLQEVINYMQQHSSDIYVHAYEQFNTASMIDVRNLITDFEKQVGHVDEIILDYLKYLHPGDGIKYGASTQDVKMKKENTSEKIKNLAVEWGTRIITADQASDVPPDIWNDPAKVLTRHNISGAKNLPDSYSYFFTGNQTTDERKKGLLRINVDKFRNYRVPDKPIKIYTNYDRGRFFNLSKTRQQFYNDTKGCYEY
jgi:hypothetical protein